MNDEQQPRFIRKPLYGAVVGGLIAMGGGDGRALGVLEPLRSAGRVHRLVVRGDPCCLPQAAVPAIPARRAIRALSRKKRTPALPATPVRQPVIPVQRHATRATHVPGRATHVPRVIHVRQPATSVRRAIRAQSKRKRTLVLHAIHATPVPRAILAIPVRQRAIPALRATPATLVHRPAIPVGARRSRPRLSSVPVEASCSRS